MLGSAEFNFGWSMHVITDVYDGVYEVAVYYNGHGAAPPTEVAEHFGFDHYGIARGLASDEVAQLKADMRALMPHDRPRPVPDWMK